MSTFRSMDWRSSLSLCVLLALWGCGSDGAGPEPDPGSDPTGTVRVVVSTDGPRTDPDGYLVRLGGSDQTIDSNGTALFHDLELGNHTVELSAVAAHCSVKGETSVTVLVSEQEVADVTFEIECGLFISVDCPAFSLERSQGLPLDEIAIGSLPPSFDWPLAASVSLDGLNHEGFAFVQTGEGENPEEPTLLVPLHPNTPLEGGSVTLTVSDGTRACEPVEFVIQPLPPAEGELEGVVDGLQGILTAQADRLGGTSGELGSAPLDELPRGLWPLAIAQILLDGPSNDESLRALADGSQGDEVLAWLNRLLARTQLRTVLEELPGADETPGRRPQRDASPSQCKPEGVAGNDPSVLDDCMAAAAEARRRTEGIAKKVADDIGKALSTASQLELPAAGIVEAALSSLFWIIQSERQKAASLYPSRFTKMNLEVSRHRFAEDEDAEGRVSQAEVFATSEGFDLLQEIVDGINQALSLAQSTGEFDISTGTPVDLVTDRFLTTVEKQIRSMDVEELDVPPELFGPVNVKDPDWIQVRVAAGEAIEMTGDLMYEPVLWGPATLSVRTFDGKFGGQQIAEQAEIEVPPIQMILSPKDTVAKASEEDDLTFITFELEVLEASSPDSVDLDLSEHPRQGSAEIRVTEGGSVHYVDYLAPMEPNFDEPDLIVVRHTAKGGARANGPPRTETATVRFASVTISPRNTCVEPGEETDPFEADVRGLEDESVTWWASEGDIDQNGVFTAPSEAPAGREVTLRATSVAQPEISDEITVQIGACNVCRYDITLSGGVTGVGQGPAGFAFDEGYLELVLDGDLIQDTPGDRIHSTFDVTWDGEPGTYNVTYGSVANRTSGGWVLYDPGDPVADCDLCGGTVTVEEVGAEVILGRFDMTLPTITPDPDLSTSVNGTFRASLITPDSHDLDAFRQCVSEGR